MPVISIIVPVYNTEKYLHRCLDSIIAQKFTDFECILVDDGSSDNSSSICDEYARNDNRISVIHKENTGVALARDIGIKRSKGDFLLFVDGDDWIELNALEVLYYEQKRTNADIVLGGINELFNKNIVYFKQMELTSFSYSLEYFLLNKYKSLWGKLYRKELFNDYVVPSINNGEDLIINYQIFRIIKMNKLQNVNIPVYNYYHNITGITGITSKTQDHIKGYSDFPPIKCRLIIEDILNKENQNDKIITAFICCIIKEGINPYLRINKHIRKDDIKIFYEKYYLFIKRKGFLNFGERILIPVFNISISLGRFLVVPLFIIDLIIQNNFSLFRVYINKWFIRNGNLKN